MTCSEPAAEAIVVGGGHNGLICAAYLARAGVETLLVEARDDVGGCAATVSDLGARFNICSCDHSMVRAMPVIDELDLAAHGLRYLEPEGSVQRFHDGATPWALFHDVEQHLDALAHTYPHQVDAYRRYLDDALPVAALVLAMARSRPALPAMSATLARRRAEGAGRLLAWSRRSAASVLGDYFDDWHLVMPAISSGPTVWGASPDAPGTGLAAVAYATRHLVRSGRPIGGSGALTDAARASFEAAGGTVRAGSRVERLLVRDGAAAGVRLADGTRLAAPIVVAACDPQRVFVEWFGAPGDVPPAARRLVARWRARPAPDGYQSKLDAVLVDLPRWAAPVPGAELDLLGASTTISPDPAALAAAHALRAEGWVSPVPTMLVNVPTVLDPEMQPVAGQHVLSLEVLFTPYGLPGGWAASREPERWLALLAGFMEPGTLRVERWRAMTPERYDAELTMHRGHAPAYSGTPLAALLGRHRETTRYRTPIPGLYLSGAGTFPGAGVFGASGRNAAGAVIGDRRHGAPVVDRARRWWSTRTHEGAGAGAA